MLNYECLSGNGKQVSSMKEKEREKHSTLKYFIKNLNVVNKLIQKTNLS